MDDRPDLRTMTESELEEWRTEQIRRSRALRTHPYQPPTAAELARPKATWPTVPWDFPLTPGAAVRITANHLSARLMTVRGLRHVDGVDGLACLVGDEHGLLALRHRDPRGSWGDDPQAASVRAPSPNVLLPVYAWSVPADVDPLPASGSHPDELLAQTKGIEGQP